MLVPVLQPIAPRRAPVGERIGRPPGIVQRRWGEEKRDGGAVCVSESAEVGRRLEADVVAMDIAVSMLDSLAESCRVKDSRCVWASTMAMLIGKPCSEA
jgi:hypothetical protein